MKWVGTSWKMNKSIDESIDYINQIKNLEIPAGVQPFIIPPMSSLSRVREALSAASPIKLGAQNAHWAIEGAFTGEISMRMARDAGATIIEMGHSERRHMFGETDNTVSLKARAALDAELTPLICVGEPSDVRESGGAPQFIRNQVNEALKRINATELDNIVIAYEPIWAIGETGREPLPNEIAPIMEEIAELLAHKASGSSRGPLLYGGSVNLQNAPGLLEDPNIDGLFVGRSAWEPKGLMTLVKITAESL
jgi:L-erythrulose 1-phosphate isomerase